MNRQLLLVIFVVNMIFSATLAEKESHMLEPSFTSSVADFTLSGLPKIAQHPDHSSSGDINDYHSESGTGLLMTELPQFSKQYVMSLEKDFNVLSYITNAAGVVCTVLTSKLSSTFTYIDVQISTLTITTTVCPASRCGRSTSNVSPTKLYT